MPHPYDPSKPTLVLVNSFTTSSDLYAGQYGNSKLTSAMNLLAIELLGHGKTRTPHENFTYWDTALMNLQVMESLGVKKAFVLGTSQGGWITVRMALLAPEKIEGIVPLGTSMDSESERTRSLGCWDGIDACTGTIEKWTTTKATPGFEPDDHCKALFEIVISCSRLLSELRDMLEEQITYLTPSFSLLKHVLLIKSLSTDGNADSEMC